MVDGINNIGSGLRALAGTYSANASSVAATVISSPPGISAARLNWMPVAVSKVLENNLLGLRTPMGEMSVRSHSAEFKVGDRLLIKMDASGGLSIKSDFNSMSQALEAPRNAGMPIGGALPSQPLYSPAVALSVAAVPGRPARHRRPRPALRHRSLGMALEGSHRPPLHGAL